MEDDSSEYDITLWIPKFLFLIIVTSVLMVIIYSVHYQDVTSDDVEMNLLIESLMHSPDGIVYQDLYTGRPYSTKIDFKKFERINFNDLFETKSKRYVMHVKLDYLDKSLSRYYVSGSEGTKDNFDIRTVVSAYNERMNPLGIVEKNVVVMNHEKSPFDAKLVFDVYIEK